jgi:hypothetical protein
MEKIYNLFKFVENKYPEYKIPLKFKIINQIPLTKEDLNIQGDFYLHYSEIKKLPEGLTISGDFDLTGCHDLKSLPKGLTVGGSLILDDCFNLTSLSKRLTVGNSIDLSGCENLKSLPNDLKVNTLIARYSGISEKYTKEEIKKMCPDVMNIIIQEDD